VCVRARVCACSCACVVELIRPDRTGKDWGTPSQSNSTAEMKGMGEEREGRGNKGRQSKQRRDLVG
jgi:hypothetical protein